jgi:biopolymer transport protein ExbD
MSFDITTETTIDFSDARKAKRGLGIIPLVDVAFFLLIFFMVAGTVNQFEIIDIKPPVANSGELLDEGHIVVLLGKHDEIVMDDALMTPEELSASLTEQLRQHPDKVITLKADGSIKAVKMIEIMDRIKAAGGKQVTIATEDATGVKP